MDLLLFVVVVVLLLTFAVMFRSVGLIIFQPDVLAARTTLLTGGLGILRRIIEAGTVLAFSLLLVRNHYRRYPVIVFGPVLGLLALMSATMGTKGFLFTFYALFVYYLAFLDKNLRYRLPRKVWFVAAAAIGLVLAGALGNLMFISSNSETAGDAGLLANSLIRLANRIAGFGDIGYLFFENEAYRVLQKTVIDYAGYVSNSILGFFRLVEYGAAPGAEIYAIVTGRDNLEGFGPNSQVYFVGYMFFQAFGILYSFAFGWLFAFLRRSSLVNFRTSNLDMLLFIVVNYLITSMGLDLQLAIVQSFNMVLTMVPLVGFTYLLYVLLNGRLPFKRVQLENFGIGKPSTEGV